MGVSRLIIVLILIAGLTIILIPIQFIGLIAVKSWAKKIPVFFHKCIVKLLDINITVSGEPSNHRPLLIASNHVNWLDIIILSATVPVSFIAKSQIRFWPIFGQFAQLQRSVFIKREDRRKVGDQNNAITKRLKQGDVIVLFGEGTTADGHNIYPFKSALFEAILNVGDKQGMVQPVALCYNRLHGMPIGRQWRHKVAIPADTSLIAHLVWALKTGALDVTVQFGKPIKAKGTRKTITDKAYTAVRNLKRIEYLTPAADTTKTTST